MSRSKYTKSLKTLFSFKQMEIFMFFIFIQGLNFAKFLLNLHYPHVSPSPVEIENSSQAQKVAFYLKLVKSNISVSQVLQKPKINLFLMSRSKYTKNLKTLFGFKQIYMLIIFYMPPLEAMQLYWVLYKVSQREGVFWSVFSHKCSRLSSKQSKVVKLPKNILLW